MRYLIITFLFLFAWPAYAVEELDKSNLNFMSLSVPFVVQAPLGDWSWPWQDFCEESSVLMAYAYVKGTIPNKYAAARELLRLAVYELKTLGYEKDTNIADTARMLSEYYGYTKIRVLENPTAETMKDEIRRENVILVPVAGRLLKNPNFVSPGPRYHMVVVKGFDGDVFIVNDPGTRRGDSFRYSVSTIMNAMHDLVPGDILSGPKQVLVIEKS
ncbi:MAG: C39 family peptidase [Candidatus Sungbacteria bacterium]|nr:C39 family peptidase [Candidatus Sungbacteria bacterium]